MLDKICKAVNRLFPLPVHPFNLQNDGVKTYAMWQFEKGEDTIKFFLDEVTPQQMFENKTVLDVGSGAGGKTLYYAKFNVNKIYGLDVVKRYQGESCDLARQLGLSEKFEFCLSDAKKTPFTPETFDTIIMNDAMEHIDNPSAALDECYRILKPKGRVYINFPPYNHPFGAHLSDVIGIPYVHIFFGDKTLIKVYKDLVQKFPDAKERISFRISKDKNGNEYFSYINKMTIKRFKKIIENTDLKLKYYKEVPLRGFLKPFAKLPVLKEYTNKMVVAILEK